MNHTRQSFAAIAAMRMLVSCLTYEASAAPGDEQWDGRFGQMPADFFNLGQLVVYRGEVYGSRYKWDGTHFSPWPDIGSDGAKVVLGDDLYAAGYFKMTNGALSGISRWDGTNWHHLGAGIPRNDFGDLVGALAVQGGDLFVGGGFDGPYGQADPQSSITRWDGSNWHGLAGGVSSDEGNYHAFVLGLATQGNNLFAGGAFDQAGGVACNGVARWNGTNWAPLGSGIQGFQAFQPYYVWAMAVMGNDLYVSGQFAFAGGVPVNNIARWDGINWHALGAGITGGIYGGDVRAMAVSGTNLYVGGTFASAGGITASNIARWDGAHWSALGGGLLNEMDTNHPAVQGLLVRGDDVLVSGVFTHAGGKPSQNFALWHSELTPTIQMHYTNGVLNLSWTASATIYVLEWNAGISGTNWAEVTPAPQTNGYSASPAGPNKFFRLRKVP